jgi:ubiquinone/menaquinone biosynthesis C-methylase UbiE
MSQDESVGIVLRDPAKYERLMHMLLRGKEQSLRDATVAFAGIRAGEKVLDIGCASGNLARAAKVKVGDLEQVIGIDPSPEMVAFALAKSAEQHVPVTFETGTIQKLRFDTASFDVVFCSLVLHHIPAADRVASIQECCRVLKPAGRLIVMEFWPPSSRFKKFLWFLVVGHKVLLKTDQFLDLMKEGGFPRLETGATAWDVLKLVKCEK